MVRTGSCHLQEGGGGELGTAEAWGRCGQDQGKRLAGSDQVAPRLGGGTVSGVTGVPPRHPQPVLCWPVLATAIAALLCGMGMLLQASPAPTDHCRLALPQDTH